MWQRIQTLYLVIVAVLMGLFAFSDIFLLTSQAGEAFLMSAWGLRGATQTVLGQMDASWVWSLGVLAIINVVVAVVAIFFYHNRPLQARITIFSTLLSIGITGLMAFLGYNYSESTQIGFKFALVYPLVSIILQVMAVRAIWADETLVRISNRLRD